MEPLTQADIVASVLFANLLTLAAIYAVWRIKRNEKDHLGRIMILAVCGIGLLYAYASST